MIMALNKPEREGNFPELIKGFYKNPQLTVYLIVKIGCFPSKIRNMIRMSILVTSIQLFIRGASQGHFFTLSFSTEELAAWGTNGFNSFICICHDLKVFSPGCSGSVDWVPACKPKGHWFDSWPGHIPGLWAKPQGISHTLLFLSLSFSLPSLLSKSK